MPFCPLGGFTFTTDVTTDLFYKNFLLIGSSTVPYYVRTLGYSFCDAFFGKLHLQPMDFLGFAQTNPNLLPTLQQYEDGEISILQLKAALQQ